MADAKPFDLTKYLGRSKNRIYRVGVELEGGWKKLPEGVEPIHDGSVMIQQGPPQVDPRTGREIPPRERPTNIRFKVGELPSDIMEVGNNKLDMTKVGAWIRQFYPSKVNASCGLHTHMSFKHAGHYQLLMIPEYQATVIEYLGRWAKEKGLKPDHPIWPRLRGENKYCRLDYFADSQAAMTTKVYNRERPGNRYTAINYSFNQHGTIECRVLPMMEDAETAVSAVEEILRITNACLASQRKKEEKLIAGIPLEFKEGVRDHSEEVIAPERIVRNW